MASFGVAELRMRAYFSSYHLWAAEHFTRLAKEIEDAHTGSPEFNIAHRAYVTNAILSAVAFLEAAINELFDDVVDQHYSYVNPLSNGRLFEAVAAERLATPEGPIRELGKGPTEQNHPE